MQHNMLRQTINGKDVIIIHKPTTDTYLVIFNDDYEMVEVNERPVTDQDVERIECERRQEIRNVQERVIGMMLADLMIPEI